MAILRVRDENGNVIEIPAIVGPRGERGEKGEQGEQGEQGIQGPSGSDYVLTDADKQEIIDGVLAALPAAQEASF